MQPIYNHEPRKAGVEVQRRINALKIGQKMQDLPEELWHDSFYYYVKKDPNRIGGPNLRLIRLDPDEPSLTVTGHVFNKFVHPYENRFITPREAARLQGFPDHLKFCGSLTSVQRQVGDAVPIRLGAAVFETLLETMTTIWPDRQSFHALSLFSGAGGFDIAAEQAGIEGKARIKPFACVEVEKDRCNTLRGYFGDKVKVFQKDIRDLSAIELIADCGFSQQDIALIYGGPPCQSFSQAGKQAGVNDPRGDLIFEFVHFVNEIKPPFFIMENVSNLKAIDKGRLLQQILQAMRDAGYRVKYQVLMATDYGSPQKRRRLIFVGTRHDIELQAKLPEPTHGSIQSLFDLKPVKTVRDAFKGLPSADYEPVQVPPMAIQAD